MNVITILCDTLRRNHVGAYTGGAALDQYWSREAPAWSVPTLNMDRLAARGIVFDNAYIGSTPCMPARRDIYTGRLELLERGWGPLEEKARDLPRQVAGPPNRSVQWIMEQGQLPVDRPLSSVGTGLGQLPNGLYGFPVRAWNRV